MRSEDYRYEVKSIDGFLAQASRYIANGGHYFYIRVRVPEGKDPSKVAEKLLDRYDIRKKRWQRKRRHLKETASIHLLQYRDLIVIMLTKGEHKAFYADHGNQVQDIIAHMRLWDYAQAWRRPRAIAEMSERAIETGRENFTAFCSGCHGPNGQGLKDGPEYFAPALNNPEFLQAASGGFLLATIARGRSLTPMRAFGMWAGGIAGLDGGEISDIVSYIRTWQESHRQKGTN